MIRQFGDDSTFGGSQSISLKLWVVNCDEVARDTKTNNARRKVKWEVNIGKKNERKY